MIESIVSIKARMFEIAVEELYRLGNKTWLGRIRDAIKELGANTVYEIAKGVAYPETIVCGMLGEKIRAERTIDDS